MLGRMPVVFAVLLFVVGLLALPQPAQADPHAVFYTAIGQRQLFFNTLAALDQADYVEPALGDNSRQELAQARRDAGFTEGSEDSYVTATNTNLSTLLTRSVTLEGYDLFTALLGHDFATERARRLDSVPWFRRTCTVSIGIKNCDRGAEDPADQKERQHAAYISSGQELGKRTFQRGGLATALSGSEQAKSLEAPWLGIDPATGKPYADGKPTDKVARNDVITKQQNQVPQDSLIADNGIEGIRFETTRQGTDDEEDTFFSAIDLNDVRKSAEWVIAKATASLLPNYVDPLTFQNFTQDRRLSYALDETRLAGIPVAIAQDQNPCQGQLEAAQFLDCYIADFFGVFGFTQATQNALAEGEGKYLTDVASNTNPNTKQRAISRVERQGGLGVDLGINTEPQNPGSLRNRALEPVGLADARAQQLGQYHSQLIVDTKYKTSEQANTDQGTVNGTTQLADDPAVRGYRVGEVIAGLRTNVVATEDGQVAGDIDDGNIGEVENLSPGDGLKNPLFDGEQGDIYQLLSNPGDEQSIGDAAAAP